MNNDSPRPITRFRLAPLPKRADASIIEARIERALAVLAEAVAVPEFQDIYDEAIMLEKAVRLWKLGQDAARRAAEIRLRCERYLGKFVPALISRGRPPKNVDDIDNFHRTTLTALGLKRDFHAHCKRVAAVPDRFFELFFRDAARFQWEITNAEFFRRTDAYRMAAPFINAHQTPPRKTMRTAASNGEPSRVELHHGDCLAVMPHIPDHSVDLIAADLPYGSRLCEWDTPIDLERLWAEFVRVIRPYHPIILTATQPFASLLVMPNRKWFKSEIVWEKHRAPNFVHAAHRPMTVHENIYVFSAGGAAKRAAHPMPYYPHQPEDQIAGYPVSIIYYELDTPRLHPAAKPVAMMRYLIELYSRPGETVLDCCMGSASTGVAALQSARHFIGIELDDYYFNVAARRLGQAD